MYGSKKEQLKARLFLKAKSARVSAIAASFAFLILIIHRIEQLLDIAELELISQITLISFYALMGISLFSLNNSLKSGKYSE
ncbi:MAG: hypothetical protein JXA43_02910 [Candidatus Diapherotrites archaeon]|nr:hypothetical protein [Candidatus Diapherotrites archaeon]